ncbi:D-isomer specific 2-hydroxyacid dehydrogenase,catalytic domain [Moorella glycerini]|uniref:D-3-phosphoglycerate dehydrogenase n=1 Tax=Neomoorella stamsii TaxID=1266720 RepID=A0A9X7J5G2_9FIRM|nr:MULTISPECIES: phosphoglycerate dehydrogenase [Moorella]PRR77565.1 D-3-phosphoglycerate dehydrogenase [Moorella stamsii]CEP69388.1 D-isomer specific 2-hydroxyacid dehydrogenase,catalytic domain [Moorella glycerini]
MFNVLITARVFGRYSQEPFRILENGNCRIAPNPWPGQKLKEAEILSLVADVDGIICGEDEITARVIAAAQQLKVISKFGVGVDKIDVAAATERKIAVCNAPGANSNSVADMAFCLLLAVARKLTLADKQVRTGVWQTVVGIELWNKTIGIIGLGKIGKAVALRAKGFQMRILAFDSYPDRDFITRERIELVSLEELLSQADFISLHLPATPETRGLIGAKELALTKSGAILVNTSRGDIVDEAALYTALKEGRLGGAGLDVFNIEPPDTSSPLFELPNVVVSPHSGAHTVEAINKMGTIAAQNVVNVLNGIPPIAILNPKVLRKGD